MNGKKQRSTTEFTGANFAMTELRYERTSNSALRYEENKRRKMVKRAESRVGESNAAAFGQRAFILQPVNFRSIQSDREHRRLNQTNIGE